MFYRFSTGVVSLDDPPPAKIHDLSGISSNIGRFDKFEIQFAVETDATNPGLPFDSSPPSGLQGEIGVTVDGLFSDSNWQSTIIQPAFFDQSYDHRVLNGTDHFTPDGAPHWTVRFAPMNAGDWQYRIRVQDSEGTTYYPPQSEPALSFSVHQSSANPYTQRGFLQVSPSDPRYFEFADGTPFIGVGFNDGFQFSQDVENRMQTYEANKMNFMRVWLSGDGINGSQWTSWASHHLPGDGYMPGVNFDTDTTYNDSDVSFRLDDSNPCFFGDFWQGGIPVLPNTTYNISARIKTEGIAGPRQAGDYGFVIKRGDWLNQACDQTGIGTRITTPVSDSNGDWITVQGNYITGSSQYWLDYLYLVRENATDGEVFIDNIRVWKADDPAQVNLLREPNANSHLFFDPMNAAKWDKFITSAEDHGVYLKLVIDEKNEWIRNRIQPDGSISSSDDNDNFYAAPGTKGRWLQEAWWRYIIARWGYSTAIHSFEYINEGDPYNGNHHEAANALAEYFDRHDPSDHMVTTSFWHSFPNIEFWSNDDFSAIDYADIHAYLSTGWGTTAAFLSAGRTETRPEYVHSGEASAHFSGSDNGGEAITPRGLVIQGSGEWILRYYMKAENLSANCPYETTGGMQTVSWELDGGTYWGGKEGVVPPNNEGKDFICTSPDGTFDWTLFTSDQDRDGNTVPAEYRIILTDNDPHEFSIYIENSNGVRGDAWIDSVELVDPDGKVSKVIGEFITTRMDEDAAWYNRAYGEVYGGGSVVGARMPLVRGETSLDSESVQDWDRDLLQDTEGVWLHNNVWGQINPGAMYDLFWWATETIPESIYGNFLSYRNFMEGIPLSNGHYYDVDASTTNPKLRAWGQRDDVNGAMHLWVQNMEHTWKNVVDNHPNSSVDGTIIIPNIPDGDYEAQWWRTSSNPSPIFLTQTLTASDGALEIVLPITVSDDVAVKVIRIGGAAPTPTLTSTPTASATVSPTGVATSSPTPTASALPSLGPASGYQIRQLISIGNLFPIIILGIPILLFVIGLAIYARRSKAAYRRRHSKK
ncbi:MAG: hypothetical protein ACERKY_02255 [Anaerolineales bacterium]